MASDIKLDGNYLIFEGNWTKLQTLDLMLDAPSRRKDSTGFRRALVHDHQDGLTMNYNSDYPGGVSIKGKTRIEELEVGQKTNTVQLKANNIEANSIKVGSFKFVQSTISHLTLGDNTATKMMELNGPGLRITKELRVYGNATFDEDLQTPDILVKPKNPGGNAGDHPRYRKFRLTERLQNLADENEGLKEKIVELEERLRRLERRS